MMFYEEGFSTIPLAQKEQIRRQKKEYTDSKSPPQQQQNDDSDVNYVEMTCSMIMKDKESEIYPKIYMSHNLLNGKRIDSKNPYRGDCWHCGYNLSQEYDEKNTDNDLDLFLRTVYIPEYYDEMRNFFIITGFACSLPCAKAYIDEHETYNSANKRVYLNLLARKFYKYMEPILPAPPREILRRWGGNVSIEDFRSKFKNIKMTSRSPPCVVRGMLLEAQAFKKFVQNSKDPLLETMELFDDSEEKYDSQWDVSHLTKQSKARRREAQNRRRQRQRQRTSTSSPLPLENADDMHVDPVQSTHPVNSIKQLLAMSRAGINKKMRNGGGSSEQHCSDSPPISQTRVSQTKSLFDKYMEEKRVQKLNDGTTNKRKQNNNSPPSSPSAGNTKRRRTKQKQTSAATKKNKRGTRGKKSNSGSSSGGGGLLMALMKNKK